MYFLNLGTYRDVARQVERVVGGRDGRGARLRPDGAGELDVAVTVAGQAPQVPADAHGQLLDQAVYGGESGRRARHGARAASGRVPAVSAALGRGRRQVNGGHFKASRLETFVHFGQFSYCFTRCSPN